MARRRGPRFTTRDKILMTLIGIVMAAVYVGIVVLIVKYIDSNWGLAMGLGAMLWWLLVQAVMFLPTKASRELGRQYYKWEAQAEERRRLLRKERWENSWLKEKLDELGDILSEVPSIHENIVGKKPRIYDKYGMRLDIDVYSEYGERLNEDTFNEYIAGPDRNVYTKYGEKLKVYNEYGERLS